MGRADFPLSLSVRHHFVLDATILTALVAVVSLVVIHVSTLFPTQIYYGQEAYNIWFGSDPPRVFSNLTDFYFDNRRSVVHPAFTILFWPLTRVLIALGFPDLIAAKVIIAASAALCVGMLYAIARRIGLRPADATLACLVFMLSASFIFWFGLVETFPIAAATLCCMLFIAVVNPVSSIPWILGSAATLSITTTNWSLGILTAYFFNDRSRFLKITISAFLLVSVLAVVQKILMPSSILFWAPFEVSKEQEYLNMWASGGDLPAYYLHRIFDFWLNTGVSSESRIIQLNYSSGEPFYLTYASGIQNLSPIGWIATVSWAAMLGAGFVGMVQRPELKQFSLAVAGYLAAQTVLHMVYGDEPFLYSLHFLPAMIVVCQFGFLGSAKHVSRLAASIFIVTAAIANHVSLHQALYRVYAGLELTDPFAMIRSPDPGNIVKGLLFAGSGDVDECLATSVTVVASGTSHEGPPVFKLIIDGAEMGERVVPNAPTNTKHAVTDEEIGGTLTPYTFNFEGIRNPKELRVRFTNDLSAGQGESGDRDFYIKTIWIGSRRYPADLLEIYGDGARFLGGEMVGLYSNGSIVLHPRPPAGCE